MAAPAAAGFAGWLRGACDRRPQAWRQRIRRDGSRCVLAVFAAHQQPEALCRWALFRRAAPRWTAGSARPWCSSLARRPPAGDHLPRSSPKCFSRTRRPRQTPVPRSGGAAREYIEGVHARRATAAVAGSRMRRSRGPFSNSRPRVMRAQHPWPSAPTQCHKTCCAAVEKLRTAVDDRCKERPP